MNANKAPLSLTGTTVRFFCLVGALEIGTGLGFIFSGIAFGFERGIFGIMLLIVGYGTVGIAGNTEAL